MSDATHTLTYVSGNSPDQEFIAFKVLIPSSEFSEGALSLSSISYFVFNDATGTDGILNGNIQSTAITSIGAEDTNMAFLIYVPNRRGASSNSFADDYLTVQFTLSNGVMSSYSSPILVYYPPVLDDCQISAYTNFLNEEIKLVIDVGDNYLLADLFTVCIQYMMNSEPQFKVAQNVAIHCGVIKVGLGESGISDVFYAVQGVRSWEIEDSSFYSVGPVSATKTASGITPNGYAPQNIAVTFDPSEDESTLTWEAPLFPGTFTVTNYLVYKKMDTGSFTLLATLGSSVLTYTDTDMSGASVGSQFSYYVTAQETYTVLSTSVEASTGEVSFSYVTAPSVPLNLAVFGSSNVDGRGVIFIQFDKATSTGGLTPTVYTVTVEDQLNEDGFSYTYDIDYNAAVDHYSHLIEDADEILESTYEITVVFKTSGTVTGTLYNLESSSAQTTLSTFGVPYIPNASGDIVYSPTTSGGTLAFIVLSWDPIGSPLYAVLQNADNTISSFPYNAPTITPTISSYYGWQGANQYAVSITGVGSTVVAARMFASNAEGMTSTTASFPV